MSKTVIFVAVSVFNAVLLAFADGLIKKSVVAGSFTTSLKSQWLYLAALFYLIQILLIAYLFLQKWELGILGNVFVVFYSVSTIALGYFMFAEKLAPIQVLGVTLGLIGVLLMTMRA